MNVVRQVLVEALLVGISGGLGMLLARWGVVALVALAPTELPRAGEIRVDAAVLIFSLAVSSLTGVLFGVIPALTSASVDLRDALQGGGRGTTAGGQRIRGMLVSSEVALAVVLLIVMTMLAKSFANVQAVAPGFVSTRVLSARLTLPPKRFNTPDAIVTFQRLPRGCRRCRRSRTPVRSHLPLTACCRACVTARRTIDAAAAGGAVPRSPGYFEAARIR